MTREGAFGKFGYKLEGIPNWTSYIPVNNSGILAHDVYHHRDGESGYYWQEIRALGAMLWFEEQECYRKPPMYVSSHLLTGLRKNVERTADHFPKDLPNIDLPSDALAHHNQIITDDDDLHVFLSLMTSGFQYAKAIGWSQRSYEKLLKFKPLAANNIAHDYIIIDRSTGKVEFGVNKSAEIFTTLEVYA